MCVCVCVCSINGHRAAMLCTSLDKYVDSEPQWAHGQYTLLNYTRQNWFKTNWNSWNRCTACRQRKGYERTVKNEIWCNSCCIYIAGMGIWGMFCIKKLYISPDGKPGFRIFHPIWFQFDNVKILVLCFQL